MPQPRSSSRGSEHPVCHEDLRDFAGDPAYPVGGTFVIRTFAFQTVIAFAVPGA